MEGRDFVITFQGMRIAPIDVEPYIPDDEEEAIRYIGLCIAEKFCGQKARTTLLAEAESEICRLSQLYKSRTGADLPCIRALWDGTTRILTLQVGDIACP